MAELRCPWCGKVVAPHPQSNKLKRKKVELTVLLCPRCEEVWQFRGPLAETVRCPSCQHEYDPRRGNVPDKGLYLCACGNQGKLMDSIRSLPDDQLLPEKHYVIEGYCPACDSQTVEDDDFDGNGELFELDGHKTPKSKDARLIGTNRDSILWKNNGKFFQRVHSTDLASYQRACSLWDKHKSSLPHPKSKIPFGEKTKTHLIGHHYNYWSDLFNPRQLLCLSTILSAICREDNSIYRDMLLSNFQMLIERNSMFCRYYNDRDIVRGMFSRHDFHPLTQPAETNIMGQAGWGGTWDNLRDRLIEGKAFNHRTFDWKPNTGAGRLQVWNDETVYGDPSAVNCHDSREVATLCKNPVDAVITDPPYADNVNYSELADFFYVWLRLALLDREPCFAPDSTPKTCEIVENRTRGVSREQYADGLKEVFEAAAKTTQDGLLVFTFHHKEGSAWESLLDVLIRAGLSLEAVYPIHGDSETSMHLMDKEGAISYDLIHGCRKRQASLESKPRSWAGVRQTIRERARNEIATIESGRYGNESLPVGDRNIILIGKCLELYSEHYGHIVDHEGKPVPLRAALEEIRMMVDQLTTAESALPPELEDIDTASYVYLTCLCDRREVKSDEVHKATRGISEPSALMERDLMIKGRAKRGRSYEVKSPMERLDFLKKKFGVQQTDAQGTLFDEDLTAISVPGVIFIDYVHFLIGLAENGESVLEWLDKFRGKRPQIRAALEYLAKRNRTFLEPVRKIMGLMDEKTLFSPKEDKHA